MYEDREAKTEQGTFIIGVLDDLMVAWGHFFARRLCNMGQIIYLQGVYVRYETLGREIVLKV